MKVQTMRFSECRIGQHDDCPGVFTTPKGVVKTKCTCKCHTHQDVVEEWAFLFPACAEERHSQCPGTQLKDGDPKKPARCKCQCHHKTPGENKG